MTLKGMNWRNGCLFPFENLILNKVNVSWDSPWTTILGNNISKWSWLSCSWQRHLNCFPCIITDSIWKAENLDDLKEGREFKEISSSCMCISTLICYLFCIFAVGLILKYSFWWKFKCIDYIACNNINLFHLLLKSKELWLFRFSDMFSLANAKTCSNQQLFPPPPHNILFKIDRAGKIEVGNYPQFFHQFSYF